MCISQRHGFKELDMNCALNTQRPFIIASVMTVLTFKLSTSLTCSHPFLPLPPRFCEKEGVQEHRIDKDGGRQAERRLWRVDSSCHSSGLRSNARLGGLGQLRLCWPEWVSEVLHHRARISACLPEALTTTWKTQSKHHMKCHNLVHTLTRPAEPTIWRKVR